MGSRTETEIGWACLRGHAGVKIEQGVGIATRHCADWPLSLLCRVSINLLPRSHIKLPLVGSLTIWWCSPRH